METAIDIGHSCKLLDHGMDICKVVDLMEVPACFTALNSVLDKIKAKANGGKQVGMSYEFFERPSVERTFAFTKNININIEASNVKSK